MKWENDFQDFCWNIANSGKYETQEKAFGSHIKKTAFPLKMSVDVWSIWNIMNSQMNPLSFSPSLFTRPGLSNLSK